MAEAVAFRRDDPLLDDRLSERERMDAARSFRGEP